MKQNEFAIQLMAKGSFVDSGVGNGCSYLVEAFTIRLNHIALNAWILSEMMNSRDCYSTDKEWEAHKVEYKTKRKAVHDQILKILDINPDTEGISITQAQSEVFTVVHISELKLTGEENLPLTLEELREMNNKPIWIQNIHGFDLSGWAIFKVRHIKQIANCACEANISYYMEYYGQKWFAYRTKP